jgi:tetratricopeptide (TPR) repeat protein
MHSKHMKKKYWSFKAEAVALGLGLGIFAFACQQEKIEEEVPISTVLKDKERVFQGIDIKGDSLFTVLDSAALNDQIKKLREAESLYAKEPTLENLIWVGRRQAYLGRHDLAIQTFGLAAQKFPDAPEPLRHRGHRFITTRQFDKAVSDLEKAAQLMEGRPLEVEQDGMPNAQNIPLSNLQFNVWYHLGLAEYLQGNYEKALEAYKKCLEVSDNDDSIVATLDWYYMTLVKLGRSEEASSLIRATDTESMTIIENDAYFKRMLMYKGLIQPDSLLNIQGDMADSRLQYVTQGYGVGNFLLAQGDTVKAKSIFDNVIQTGYWSAFGYIATEKELTLLRE